MAIRFIGPGTDISSSTQQAAKKLSFPQAAQKGPDARRRAMRRLRRTPGTPQGVRERANAADGPFSAAC
jgi:hypothetical protein